MPRAARAKEGGENTVSSPSVPSTADYGDAKSDAENKEAGNPDTWKVDVHISLEDTEIREQVVELLDEFTDMWSGRLGKITAAKHRVELIPGSRPVFQHPYRAGLKTREHEKKEIDRMLKEGVIEPSISEWAAPVVFAPKKDVKLRFCVDYRRLNAVTV